MQRDPGALAVVVQPMLPAEMAGVIRTADPYSGNPDHLVLNAAWGLGEGVVSGIVTPDHWVIDRASGQIRAQQPGEKGYMVVIAPGGGTTVVATPATQRTCLTLTPAQVETLLTLAVAVERNFGTPQDIEWAYAQHRHQDMGQPTTTALLDLFEQAHEASYRLAACHIATGERQGSAPCVSHR